MLVRRIALIGTAVLLITFALSAVGSAAGRVGVVDLSLIIDESKAGKQANALLNLFIQERQAALLPLEEELERLSAELENGESLSDEERAALQEEFDAAVMEYVAAANQYEEQIEAAVQDLRDQILADIGVVLQMVGDSRGFDLIMDVSSAYYYRRTVDLTFEVIREYDDLWDEAQRQSQ